MNEMNIHESTHTGAVCPFSCLTYPHTTLPGGEHDFMIPIL